MNSDLPSLTRCQLFYGTSFLGDYDFVAITALMLEVNVVLLIVGRLVMAFLVV